MAKAQYPYEQLDLPQVGDANFQATINFLVDQLVIAKAHTGAVQVALVRATGEPLGPSGPSDQKAVQAILAHMKKVWSEYDPSQKSQ